MIQTRANVGYFKKEHVKRIKRGVCDLWSIPGFQEVNILIHKPHTSRFGAYRIWSREFKVIFSDWWLDMERTAIEQEKYKHDMQRRYNR